MPLTIVDYRSQVRTVISDKVSTQYIFQDSEIDQFTQTGVLAYSKYKGRRKPYTLILTTGVSQYTLPADWVSRNASAFNNAIAPTPDVNAFDFASFVSPTMNINSSASLNNVVFDWYDSDQYVIVTPTPQATVIIPFSYYASHTVDISGSSIPAIESDYVVLAAASRALEAIAIDRSMKMQKYKIGQGLSIDDSDVAVRLQEEAKVYWERFEKFVCYRPFGVTG